MKYLEVNGNVFCRAEFKGGGMGVAKGTSVSVCYTYKSR